MSAISWNTDIYHNTVVSTEMYCRFTINRLARVVSGLPFGRRTCTADEDNRSSHAVFPIVNFKCSDLSVCMVIWFHTWRVLELKTAFIGDIGNTMSVVASSFHSSVTLCSFVSLSVFCLLCFEMFLFTYVLDGQSE